jgi:hypothetical protein
MHMSIGFVKKKVRMHYSCAGCAVGERLLKQILLRECSAALEQEQAFPVVASEFDSIILELMQAFQGRLTPTQIVILMPEQSSGISRDAWDAEIDNSIEMQPLVTHRRAW